jgi:hypothetical protein
MTEDEQFAPEQSETPKPTRTTRAYFLETLLHLMSHCVEEGNHAKIMKLIDNLYAVGVMPVSQADLDQFEWAFDRPTHHGNYYVVDAKRRDWIEQHGGGFTVLRDHTFGMTELRFDDPEAEATFRARWC